MAIACVALHTTPMGMFVMQGDEVSRTLHRGGDMHFSPDGLWGYCRCSEETEARCRIHGQSHT